MKTMEFVELGKVVRKVGAVPIIRHFQEKNIVLMHYNPSNVFYKSTDLGGIFLNVFLLFCL